MKKCNYVFATITTERACRLLYADNKPFLLLEIFALIFCPTFWGNFNIAAFCYPMSESISAVRASNTALRVTPNTL